MSYFDEYSNLRTVNGTKQLGTKIMQFNKMCYEFAWKGGNGYHGLGFSFSSSTYARYAHDVSSNFAAGGLSSSSFSGPVIKGSLNEPILLCLDKSSISSLKLHVINASATRTLTFTSSSVSSTSEWKMILYNGYSAYSYSDVVELHLRKSEIKNKIPGGFVPWMSEGNKCIERCSCKRNSFHIFISILLSGS